MLTGGAATAVVGVAAFFGVTAATGGQEVGDDDGAAEAPPVRPVAVVERRDLVERESLDGTLGYGDTREITIGAQGTVTALTAAGTLVERGAALGEVDGRPVCLLYGGRPSWRPLGEGADITDGADIAQLEENLLALGYGTPSTLGPNDTWSQATTAAVKAWQRDLGVEQTGRIDLGAVVYTPGPVRIGGHLVAPGSPAGAPALSVTGPERLVDVDLDADRQGLLAVGQAVEVELPVGAIVAATVRSIASVVDVAPADSGGSATVAVVMVLDDPAAAAGLDQAPVDVHVVSVQAADALAVPVDALLALAEGGYAVERPDGTLVGVEIGAFADGWVQVTGTGAAGGLREGDEVVVPS